MGTIRGTVHSEQFDLRHFESEPTHSWACVETLGCWTVFAWAPAYYIWGLVLSAALCPTLSRYYSGIRCTRRIVYSILNIRKVPGALWWTRQVIMRVETTRNTHAIQDFQPSFLLPCSTVLKVLLFLCHLLSHQIRDALILNRPRRP